MLDGVTAIVSRGGEGEPRVPVYAGARMPLTTALGARVRGILHDPKRWGRLPESVQDWLRMQARRSALPAPDGLLVETFPRGGQWFLVAYGFEGRLAHQTLGMLVTRRMEHAGFGPLGFVATDYVIAVWSAFEPTDINHIFAEDILGEELEEWMADSSMLRRTFRNIAVIAGLIEKNNPEQRRPGKTMSMSADLIYDVLRKHEADHVLLRATRQEAAAGLTDIGRIGAMLARARGRITHKRLDRVSPLAVPALIEQGREWIAGGAEDALLAEAAALVAEATEGTEVFDELLEDMSEGVRLRSEAERQRPARRDRHRRVSAAANPRRRAVA
jgi:ATP-dependent Lhr-like helicase